MQSCARETILELNDVLTKEPKITIPCAVNLADVVKLYGIQGCPTNFFIRPGGKVAYATLGYGEESFQRLVDEVGKLGISTKNYHILK